MKCPQCETVDLTMSERQGVEIDYRPKCRGVWLDRGESTRFLSARRNNATSRGRYTTISVARSIAMTDHIRASVENHS